MLRGLSQLHGLPSGGGDLMTVFRSIAEVTTGQVMPGAQVPQNTEGKVVLYRTASCGYCKQAASYMQRKQIPFVERDVEANTSYQAEYRQLGGKGVPLMVMADKTLSGFSESSFNKSYSEFQRTLSSGQGALSASNQASNRERPSSAGFNDGSGMQSGDALVARIAGTQVYQHAAKSAPRLSVLAKAEEVIFLGEETNGMYRIASAKGEGWVDRVLMKKP